MQRRPRKSPLPRSARDLRLLHWCQLRRRDQALQLGNAGAAIGAGLELYADLGGCARAWGDGVADGAAADTKAGADDRTGRTPALALLTGQQHAPLLVCDMVGDEQALHHPPIAGIMRG